MDSHKTEGYGITGMACGACSEAAVGFEPRFLYYYCEKHKNTPPVLSLIHI